MINQQLRMRATPRFRLADFGNTACVELDGKTMYIGVTHIKYEKTGNKPASLTIEIGDTDMFEFMPDGYFDELIKIRRKILEEPSGIGIQNGSEG